ncbi:MAG: SUMF1/EgtB/PvdO family nonheme iron enzyme [Planctomycetota bacterium]
MTIRARCEKCGQEYKVKDKFAGRKFQCKKCGSPFTLPPLDPGAAQEKPKEAGPSGPPGEKGESKSDAEAPPKREEPPEKDEPKSEPGEKKGEEKAAEGKKAVPGKGRKKTGKITAQKKSEAKGADRKKADGKTEKKPPKKSGKKTGVKAGKRKTGVKRRNAKGEEKEGAKKSPLPLIAAGCAAGLLLLVGGVVVVLVLFNPWSSGDTDGSGDSSPTTEESGDGSGEDREESGESGKGEDGEENPGEDPPSESPPDEEPPDEAPPSESPPDEEPPDEEPPSEGPPDEEPPDEEPPSEGPPDEEPPDETPPSEGPPDEAPPSEGPPDEEPPDEVPPSEGPPDEEPPDEAPPSEGPPDEEPPDEAPPSEGPPDEGPPDEPPPPTPSEVAGALMDTLRDAEDGADRSKAATDLGEFIEGHQGEEFAELREKIFLALLTGLDDSDWPVRGAAAAVLGGTGDDRPVDKLIELLGESPEGERGRFSSALTSITSVDMGDSHENWKIWRETGIDDPAEIEARRSKFREFSAKARDEESKVEGGSPRTAMGLWEQALNAALTGPEKGEARARIEALAAKIEALDSETSSLYADAKEAHGSGKSVKAQGICEKILGIDPEHVGAREILNQIVGKRFDEAMAQGRRAEEEEDWEGAKAAYKKAVNFRPDDPDAVAALKKIASLADYLSAMKDGAKAEEEKDWPGAQEAFRRALDARPEDEEAKKRLERAKMAPVIRVLARYFTLPRLGDDQHGNAVVTRDGSRHDPATGLPAEIWLKGAGIEFVLIPPGEFTMGSPTEEPGRQESEGPVRKVIVEKPFYISKYEITQLQWVGLMKNNPCATKVRNFPVDMVGWAEAADYGVKLLEKIGAGAGVDLSVGLPSEAQWEYACRAGAASRYHFGDSDGDLATHSWFAGNAEGQGHPVGQKEPNPLGLYDMHGNAAEWVSDLFSPGYEGAPKDGTARLDGSKEKRIARGGSWLDSDVRSARRMFVEGGKGGAGVGFRLVIWPRAGE